MESMNSVNIDRDEIVRLTDEYGGAWGLNHTRRLLHLIAIIGEDQTYDADAVWVAAHLHDWGGYSPWLQKGVDHAIRSKQVAETFLAEHNYPEDFKLERIKRMDEMLAAFEQETFGYF